MLLRGLTWLVLFQLLGTALNHLFLSILPGPIIGLVLLMAFLMWADESLQWVELASRMRRLVQFALVCLGAGVIYFGALWLGGFKLLAQFKR